MKQQPATTLEFLALGKAGWIKHDEITVGEITLDGTIVHVYKKPEKFQSTLV